MNYYENIIDEKKDLEPLLLSKEKFEFMMIVLFSDPKKAALFLNKNSKSINKWWTKQSKAKNFEK